MLLVNLTDNQVAYNALTTLVDTLFSPFHQQNNFPFMELVSPMDSMQADPASAFETIGPYLKSAAQRVSQM